MNPLDPPTQPIVVALAGWADWDSGPMRDADRRLPVQPWAPAHQAHRQVTKDRRETRHGLHLLLTLCTFGVWAVTGWPIAWAWNRFGPRRTTITTYR